MTYYRRFEHVQIGDLVKFHSEVKEYLGNGPECNLVYEVIEFSKSEEDCVILKDPPKALREGIIHSEWVLPYRIPKLQQVKFK